MLDKIIEEQIKNSLLGESKEMIKNYAKDIVFTMYMSNAMFGQEVLEELKQFLIQELNKNIHKYSQMGKEELDAEMKKEIAIIEKEEA